MTRSQHILKRSFDLLVSIPGILLALPILLILVFLATLDTRQWGWFVQIRIGRFGRPFNFYKIRTLRGAAHRNVHDMRNSSTSFGRWLRRTKLDELAQLVNVVLGQMSLVGPRPDLPGYADKLEGEDRIILELRPGLTGPAAIKYRNEDALLASQDDPNTYNDTVIWPENVSIHKSYYHNWSFWGDLGYLWQTIFPKEK
jgi:lipopolysaccharide/colanic/teichoic acid biosynthesis glycosyltransferase